MRCMDCGDLVPAADTRKYGNQVKCCECHSSYRFCRDNVGNWNKLTAGEKSEYIKNNKGQGGRGKKRELITNTAVRPSVFALFHGSWNFAPCCPNFAPAAQCPAI